jgi:hypothetical protein
MSNESKSFFQRMEELKQQSDGTLEGGFGSVMGGFTKASLSNSFQCFNQNDCGSSNLQECTNLGFCTGSNGVGCGNGGDCSGTNDSFCSNWGNCTF